MTNMKTDKIDKIVKNKMVTKRQKRKDKRYKRIKNKTETK